MCLAALSIFISACARDAISYSSMSRSSRSMPAIADDASAKKRRSSAVVWRAASRSTYLLLPSSAVCARERRARATSRDSFAAARSRAAEMRACEAPGAVEDDDCARCTARAASHAAFSVSYFSRMAATDPTSSSMNAWRFPTSALCTRLPSDSRSMPTARSVSAIGVSKGAPMAAAIGADISSSSAETPWWPTRSSAAAKFASAEAWWPPASPSRPMPSIPAASAAPALAPVSAPSTPPRLSTPRSNAVGAPERLFA